MAFRAIESRVAGIRAPLRVKLQIGFLLVIGVLLVTGVVSLVAIAGIREQTLDLERMDASVHLALGLDHSIVLQEHLSSMFLLTAEDGYDTKLVAEQKRFRELLGQLGAKGATRPEIAGIEEAFGRYERAANSVRQLRRAGQEAEAQQTHVAQEHTIAHQIEILTKALVRRMGTLQEGKHQEIVTAQRWSTWTMAGFFAFSVALALVLGAVLSRSILRPVRRVHIALERIAQGEFVTIDDVVNHDELGSLVSNVNRMSQRLADLYARERHTAQALGEQLAALDDTQAQLRQAQKMEAVGRLAGGVAHDFNNLLTVIGGRASLLLAQLPARDAARRHVELITKTADRASALTQQLLAFSRKQLLQPRVLDLSALVEGIVPMLRRLIGEQIDLVTQPGPLGCVKADPTQLEQVILNLAVNARDAMPNHGTLTIEIRPARPGEVPGPESPADGPGVCLVVRDSGVGMSSEVQTHVFEPFFTTKGPGKGTGLGLATVYGIVKQSGGYVWISSEPGQGTTVTIWLPEVEGSEDALGVSRGEIAPSPGDETILLVEDETDVRDFAREVLQSFGYTVLEARDGEDALRLDEERGQPLQLVLTDVVMPKLGGRELAERLARRHPEMRVLYMSGYTDDALGDQGVLAASALLLPKPFTPQELARRVRQALDGSAIAVGL